jgi:signal transduction histidine kinase
MADPPPPHQKLHLFLKKIGIQEIETDQLEPYRALLVSRKHEFADYFYDFFYDMADTRAILESESEPGLMKRVWSSWFESFFRSKPNDEFLAYLWGVGVRHVEVNLDQRFSNLGFAMIRQFCHKVVSEEIPLDRRDQALSTINKMLDLCLLTETTAYIETTISCDIEVMREVADRVRNPALVIGWNIRKMQKKVTKGTPEYKVFEILMAENQRLEHMVGDIKVYMEVFEGEPEFRVIEIGELLERVLERLETKIASANVRVEVDLHRKAGRLRGDPHWLENLFYYLIQNSAEAVGQENPFISISSRIEKGPLSNVQIEIFNSGRMPEEESERLFTPFFSTKVAGTGFGLPIARLVAKKHHGTLALEPVDGRGTRAIVSLPNPG